MALLGVVKMSKCKILQNNIIKFSQSNQISLQPNLDYVNLSCLFDKNINFSRIDLRKEAFKDYDYSKHIDNELSSLDKNSIIPIPGSFISLENSDSQIKPPDSDWIAPHGPQWGPMLQ